MNRTIREYLDYLKFNRHYSPNTLLAYQRDLEKFYDFLLLINRLDTEVSKNDIREFMRLEFDEGRSKRTMKRRLSGLRGYYAFHYERKNF